MGAGTSAQLQLDCYTTGHLDEVRRLGRVLREALLVGAHVGEDGEDDEAELQQEAHHRQHHLRSAQELFGKRALNI